jgi:urea carboxylase
VLEAGVQTTVQDWPGRTGYWDVGVPPSGPMDDLALRAGQPPGGQRRRRRRPGMHHDRPDAALQLRRGDGPDRRAHAATLDGEPLPLWQAHAVKAGSVLKLGAVKGRPAAQLPGRGAAASTCRCTWAANPPSPSASSAATPAAACAWATCCIWAAQATGPVLAALPLALQPPFTATTGNRRALRPHGAPDFFTDPDIASFFATDWEVHYNSSRTGVRLIGPKPEWARTDGGEAGLHPSNIHDNAYAIGAIDFTGDMPVILGPTAPAWAASSARPWSCRPNCGSWASCAPATPCASCR